MEKDEKNIKELRASPSGTKEWAATSVNCCTGCSHDCLYCYARLMAVRFGQVKPEEWKDERVRWSDVHKKRGLKEGTIMFPSSHDITPRNLLPCMIVLSKLLKAGNRVLVVSKPHLDCIRVICRAFEAYKAEILFRFTIGAQDNKLLSFWEPNAPRYEERKNALKHAFSRGFQTSVSVEPMLDPDRIQDLVSDLTPYVTDAIWIGTMNHLKRIPAKDETVRVALQGIEENQSEERIMALYHKDNPKIKWKYRIKKIVGIPLPEKSGLDQ